MKILIVRDQLNPRMIQGMLPWLGNDKLLTNNHQLALMEPSRVELHSLASLRELIKTGDYDFAVAYENPNNVIYDDYFLATLNARQIIINEGRHLYVPQSQIREIRTPNGATLRPYQAQMVEFALQRKRVGLFVDMGLGKTLATLATLAELFDKGELDPRKPVLIVAPIMVALDTWSREARKWGYDIDIFINIKLTPKKRTKLLDRLENIDKPTILTTNPQQIGSIIEYYTERYKPFPFECIVIDELSLFKSSETNRFRDMSLLTEHVKYFIGLTGTPAPNSLLDVWSQMIIIDQRNKSLLMSNYFAYRNKFFQPAVTDKRTGQIYSWKLKPNAEHAIYERLKPTVISMRGEGLVDLPGITYVNEEVPLPPKVLAEYNKFENEIRSQFADDEKDIFSNIDGDTVEVKTRANLASKLIQLASGAMYHGDGPDDYTVYHNAKLERLKEIVESATSPILVFYMWKSDIKRAREFVEFAELRSTDPNGPDVIRRWNNGEIPVLFVQPQSVGHGLNIQEGGHTIIWLTPTWMNEVYRQANTRLYRPGQKNPVQVIHLIAKGTIDSEVIERLDNKEEGQQELLDALNPN